MSIYIIGDVHGCERTLHALIEKIKPTSNDQLWFCGDLVNRGPSSAKCIRLIKSLKLKTTCVLGNHDFYLLAVASNVINDNNKLIRSFLNEKDCDDLINWLRHQPLAHIYKNTILVHAGFFPSWTKNKILQLSDEVSENLKSSNWKTFIRNIWGNYPNYWDNNFTGFQRYRAIINGFTRIRYINENEEMNLTEKNSPPSVNKNLNPWFSHKKIQRNSYKIVFGHWSRLGLIIRPKLLALDTGCVWGGSLTAARLEDHKIYSQNLLD